jgi:GTP cyclohydrolase I
MSKRRSTTRRTKAGKARRSTHDVVDLDHIAAGVREILEGIGEDPHREGLRDTPMRVARMYEEVFAGLRQDPAEHMKTAFAEPYDGIVVLRDIPFHSMCEHHLLPFLGRCHVAYQPAKKVAGLSRLARVVEAFARRPQVQERLTEQIADLIMAQLKAKGAAVIIEAAHTCMTIRGAEKPGSEMVTSVFRGTFHSDPALRAKVLGLIKK